MKLVENVKECVFNSGGLDGQVNVEFDAELKLFSEYGVMWTPLITINNEVYSGTMLCPNPVDVATCSVFAAICAAFAPETIPQVCSEHRDIGCPAGENRDACGVCGGDGSSCTRSQAKSMALGFLLIALVMIFVVGAIGLYFKRRFARTEEQFDALRNMYQPLHDEDVNDKNVHEYPEA